MRCRTFCARFWLRGRGAYSLHSQTNTIVIKDRKNESDRNDNLMNHPVAPTILSSCNTFYDIRVDLQALPCCVQIRDFLRPLFDGCVWRRDRTYITGANSIYICIYIFYEKRAFIVICNRMVLFQRGSEIN